VAFPQAADSSGDYYENRLGGCGGVGRKEVGEGWGDEGRTSWERGSARRSCSIGEQRRILVASTPSPEVTTHEEMRKITLREIGLTFRDCLVACAGNFSNYLVWYRFGMSSEAKRSRRSTCWLAPRK
jgi:hypothetical protein